MTDSFGLALAQATDTRHVLLECGALTQVAPLFKEAFGDASAVVVADDTTYQVAGREVERLLRAAGARVEAAHLFHQAGLHADYQDAAWLRDQLGQHVAIPVAVGSGTINDLTKLASHLAGRRYMVVATAASMDGYAAFGAAITRDGYKQTMACPAPRAILADCDVLAAAPGPLTASGFGDLIGKLPAGADWLVADALGAEPISHDAWEMVQPAVRTALQGADAIQSHDPDAVAQLFRCLVMSGLAMQAVRSSRPASGAEHQLAHLWEMRGLAVNGREPSHGFKVAVGTALMTAFYERLLAHDLSRLNVDAAAARWPALADQEAEVVATHADPRLRDSALDELRAKYVAGDALRERLKRLKEQWPALAIRLREQLLPLDEVRRLLDTAGCPSAAADLGLSPAAAHESIVAARQIRRRYTSLDLAAEAGLLDSLLDELFAAGAVAR